MCHPDLTPPEVFALARGQLDQYLALATERLCNHSAEEVASHLIGRLRTESEAFATSVHLAALAIVELARKRH